MAAAVPESKSWSWEPEHHPLQEAEWVSAARPKESSCLPAAEPAWERQGPEGEEDHHQEAEEQAPFRIVHHQRGERQVQAQWPQRAEAVRVPYRRLLLRV